jgi:hypothetical protein
MFDWTMSVRERVVRMYALWLSTKVITSPPISVIDDAKLYEAYINGTEQPKQKE